MEPPVRSRRVAPRQQKFADYRILCLSILRRTLTVRRTWFWLQLSVGDSNLRHLGYHLN
jgi:hypothetical protein